MERGKGEGAHVYKLAHSLIKLYPEQEFGATKAIDAEMGLEWLQFVAFLSPGVGYAGVLGLRARQWWMTRRQHRARLEQGWARESSIEEVEVKARAVSVCVCMKFMLLQVFVCLCVSVSDRCDAGESGAEGVEWS